MPLAMNMNPFITCAVTGSGLTAHKSDLVPVTPEQIADDCIAAARAGAAVVHIHVRDPETGKGTREVALYEEAVRLVKAENSDVIINLTAGMGGDLMVGYPDPWQFEDEGTDLVGGLERLAHVEAADPVGHVPVAHFDQTQQLAAGQVDRTAVVGKNDLSAIEAVDALAAQGHVDRPVALYQRVAVDH